MVDIQFTDNSAEALRCLRRAVQKALIDVGTLASAHARDNAPVGTPESTAVQGYVGGNLKNSVKFKIIGNDCYVGTDARSDNGTPYAAFVELGTGVYAVGGRSTPWVWFDKNGKAHKTCGISATHFLKNALDGNKYEYLRVLKKQLKNT